MLKPIGNKWAFVRKLNENNNILRYKSHIVAKGFSQHPGANYEKIYFLVMDIITFGYLLSLVVFEKLNTQLMDVVIAYLYGDLDIQIT